jgi:hypothetical protein
MQSKVFIKSYLFVTTEIDGLRFSEKLLSCEITADMG